MLITLLLAFLPGFTEKIQTRVAGLKKKKKVGRQNDYLRVSSKRIVSKKHWVF